ncbi:hypothetical protein CHCC20487_3398 [Bacillus licheniformis]|nr:hypothetical protein CHCC20487_3398 [Bacillus licheniformis]
MHTFFSLLLSISLQKFQNADKKQTKKPTVFRQAYEQRFLSFFM